MFVVFRPLEVYGHDGKAINITMVPGDMILCKLWFRLCALYWEASDLFVFQSDESHSVLHGRPFPLKGRYMANIFVHFEPTGPIEKEEPQLLHNFHKLKRQRKRQSDVPAYIVPGSKTEQVWKMNNALKSLQHAFETGSTVVHSAAKQGDLKGVQSEVQKDKSLLHHKDKDGFLPLHEAVRAGHVNVARFLYESGSDLNARSHNGKGGTPLWHAKNELGDDHDIVAYLEGLGAIDVGPEL